MAMAPKLESKLREWTAAALIDAATAARIHDFEDARGETKLRWPIVLAVAFDALLMGAGVLLFVAAHWAELSPSGRFALVLAMVAAFHVAGAFAADKFEKLAIALHAVGTIALGAGIFLAGQIFNLEEHWPGGVMLWAGGAWIAWAIRRDWTQALLAAILTPWWLMGEWWVCTHRYAGSDWVAAQFALLLAFTYLSARIAEDASPVRRALTWTGALAVVPATLYLLFSEPSYSFSYTDHGFSMQLTVIGLMLAIGLPIALAYWLRGRAAWMNLGAALFVAGLGAFVFKNHGDNILAYVWEALGAIGLIAWGLKEARRERINLGIAGFGITVLGFYFSSVMDKLGRSLSLILLGILFLAGGVVPRAHAPPVGGDDEGSHRVRPLYRGLVIAAIHVALVCSLGAKLLYDRHTRPRVWAQARPVDPDLPIRGRYLSLQLIVETADFPLPKTHAEMAEWAPGSRRARLEVRNGKLVAVKGADGEYSVVFAAAPGVVMPPLPTRDCMKEPAEKRPTCWEQQNAEQNRAPITFPVVAVLTDWVLYFIPEHAEDPTPRLSDKKELWAEVTLPKKGPPRPIQLALKKDGVWMPLDLR